MRVADFLVASLLTSMLAACVTTGPDGTVQAPKAPPDAADLERRAATRLELASLYFSRGQYDIALEEIKFALAARPDLGTAYNLRGLIQAAMGDDGAADDSFARALALNPRDADAMHNRGWVHCQRNRFAEADRFFEQALTMPQYRDGGRTLLAQGVCSARAGRLEDAQRQLSSAVELDVGNPTAALNLAEVLYRRGEYERARFYIRRVNAREDVSNAQTLWLALRIENRLGNRGLVDDFGRQLRARFPQAAETLAFERGRLDD
jgi:type IV pilus assembly protein PilF